MRAAIRDTDGEGWLLIASPTGRGRDLRLPFPLTFDPFDLVSCGRLHRVAYCGVVIMQFQWIAGLCNWSRDYG